MSGLLRPHTPHSRADLLRALRFTLWLVPASMALIGIVFTLYENFRHGSRNPVNEPQTPLQIFLPIGACRQRKHSQLLLVHYSGSDAIR
ncbi:MAG: hypothetical protein HZB77_11355 [Chloroflexi bacterium]|nr:hypothetical protein [Chloroflexota bacterium]